MAAQTAALFMGLWYLASLVTLFMNKHILSNLNASAQTLAVTQMITTCVMGAAKVYGGSLCGIILGTSKAHSGASAKAEVVPKSSRTANFYRDMLAVGFMRFATVMLGLVSLDHVPVSFVETIKSSAPFFTVLFAWFILGEYTSWEVRLSLLPIAAGLALASATELEFDTIGFGAALLNNCVDCVQNVFSKKLLNGRYSYVELQFYTSAAALLVQVPMWFYKYYDTLMSPAVGPAMSQALMVALAIDATSYHLQSVFAYGLMEHISPVTHSVANTVKRALLIMLSILYWGNKVTPWSVMGMALVVVGVFVYNYARQRQQAVRMDATSPVHPVYDSSSKPSPLSSPSITNETEMTTPKPMFPVQQQQTHHRTPISTTTHHGGDNNA